MTVNYQENGIDLDYTYINANDVQYFPLETLNVTGRKVVTIGQNYQSTYPLGNVGSAFTQSNLNVPKIDQDNASLVAALPTAVVYQNRNHPNQTQIRGQFNLAENYPQTDSWQISITTNRTSPSLVGNEVNWIDVIAERDQTFIVRSDKVVFVAGKNDSGQLGVSDNVSKYSPVQFGAQNSWAVIGYGWDAGVGVKYDGTLWTWGSNNIGQLGNNTGGNTLSPIQIATDKSWISCASGHQTSFAIASDGTLWGWGRNNSFELGNSSNVNLSSPIQISNSAWKQVSGGNYFALAINSNGTLWAWGQNNYGQLPIGTNTNIQSPVQVGAVSNWKQVSASDGGDFAAAVRTDGTLWAWGYGLHGQLGQNTTFAYLSPVQVGTDTNWSKVSCGVTNTVAIKIDGTLWAWGSNSFGQLGVNTTVNNVYSPIQVGTKSNWMQISCGIYHVVALDLAGNVYTWGKNDYGQLAIQQNGLLATKLNYGL